MPIPKTTVEGIDLRRLRRGVDPVRALENKAAFEAVMALMPEPTPVEVEEGIGRAAEAATVLRMKYEDTLTDMSETEALGLFRLLAIGELANKNSVLGDLSDASGSPLSDPSPTPSLPRPATGSVELFVSGIIRGPVSESLAEAGRLFESSYVPEDPVSEEESPTSSGMAARELKKASESDPFSMTEPDRVLEAKARAKLLSAASDASPFTDLLPLSAVESLPSGGMPRAEREGPVRIMPSFLAGRMLSPDIDPAGVAGSIALFGSESPSEQASRIAAEKLSKTFSESIERTTLVNWRNVVEFMRNNDVLGQISTGGR